MTHLMFLAALRSRFQVFPQVCPHRRTPWIAPLLLSGNCAGPSSFRDWKPLTATSFWGSQHAEQTWLVLQPKRTVSTSEHDCYKAVRTTDYSDCSGNERRAQSNVPHKTYTG